MTDDANHNVEFKLTGLQLPPEKAIGVAGFDVHLEFIQVDQFYAVAQVAASVK